MHGQKTFPVTYYQTLTEIFWIMTIDVKKIEKRKFCKKKVLKFVVFNLEEDSIKLRNYTSFLESNLLPNSREVSY